MTVESLITQHIDTWTSAVKTKSTTGRGSSKKLELYGVKKLRELILELAVRGKLVPQDPSDEPASVLLERIAAEKAQLVRDKVIPRAKALPELLDSDIPNDLPTGWSIVRLGNLTSKLGSGSTPRGGKTAYVEEGVPFLRSQNIRNEGIKLDDIAYIPMETHQKMEKTKVLPNDVLLNITGASLGRSTIFPESLYEANVSQHVTIIRLIESKMSSFIHLGILSPMVQKLVWGRQVGMAIEGLSKKVLEMFEFPVPPLAEQHRIVAKVDELMALCDQLEQQTEASIEAHQLLVSTLLNTLTHSADAGELMENWARISDHFDTLFTTEESIDQLKQTILQLAVMGKLVPQDPNDEPASVLLERIAEEKAQLIKEKKIKKQKALPPIADDEKPFDLPKGWEWCRFDEIIDQRFPLSYGVLVPGNHVEGGVPLVRIGDIDLTNPPELPEKYISTEIDSKYERTRLFGGEILMAVVGSIGKLGIVPDSWKGANIARALCRILPWEGLSKDFLLVLLQSNYMQNSFMGDTRTLAQPTLNIGLIKNSLTPIPPLSEQLKIVSIVSDLFAICDNLKIGIKQSQTIQLNLTDVIVDQAI